MLRADAGTMRCILMIARGIGSNMIRRLGPRAAIDTVSHQGSVLAQHSLLDVDVFCLNLTPLRLRYQAWIAACYNRTVPSLARA